MLKGILEVTEEEWLRAEGYFDANPKSFKMRKKDLQANRSFIKIDSQIYANGKW